MTNELNQRKKAEQIDQILRKIPNALNPIIRDAKDKGYNIEHHLICDSPIRSNTNQPLASDLYLYMKKGEIVRNLNNLRHPFQADHVLVFHGDTTKETITALSKSHKSQQPKELDSLALDSLIEDATIAKIFHIFEQEVIHDNAV